MCRALLLPVTVALLSAAPLNAQVATPPAKADSAVKVRDIGVTVKSDEVRRASPIQRLTLPVTADITARVVNQTVNILDAEDAVKYLPSVFLRKRNYGDTQATMETRTWGVSSSARSLVYADGVPLSALIANNNNIGGPRWGLVAPEEIARVDMMYGPFSAAYAGNSMGAVMEITTRMPRKFEGSITQAGAAQKFALYGTDRTFGTSQTALHLGDRLGRFSFWASGNYQNSHSQPLSYVTAATFPTGTTGGFDEKNKLGTTANILGASGLLSTQMTNAKLKLAYDLSSTLRAAYTFGYWRNDANSSVESFLQKAGSASFAGQAGFASGFSQLDQRHSAHSLSLRSDTQRDWDVELTGSLYRFDKDQQRTPLTASAADTSFGLNGRLAVLDGSGWSSVDVKAAWHKGGLAAPHVVTFGAHYDRYRLYNPTYNIPNWTTSDSTATTGIATEGDGKTRTQAIWIQDAWTIAPTLRLTVGGRYEDWRAFDGYNVSGATKVTQPVVAATRLSPKGILAWYPSSQWTLSGSLGKAYRFATPAELYQLVSTGTTFTSPDPNLKPDNDLSIELRAERELPKGHARLSLFQDDVHDAIISQFLPLVPNSTTLYSYLANVDHVRSRGMELALNGNDVLVRGLELSGSVTWLDAKTLALSGRASATASAGSAIGKRLPNIPDWRANLVATYHPNDRLAVTLAGRYSGKVFTTLDNADVNPNTYQGFSDWLVADTRLSYTVNQHLTAAAGVDNLFNRKYFFFHPFPQRTLVGSFKYGF